MTVPQPPTPPQQPITRVDLFRRMPQGGTEHRPSPEVVDATAAIRRAPTGGTSYLRPEQVAADLVRDHPEADKPGWVILPPSEFEQREREIEDLRHDLRNRSEDCDRVRAVLLPFFPDEPAGEKVRAGWLAQQWAAPEIQRLRAEVAEKDRTITQLRDERDAFRQQVGDFFKAAHGPDYVYQPPEAYSALEQWLIAVSTGDVEFGARVIGAIRAALSGEVQS
ncbi:hypothetical protein ABZ215_24920 [Amycolatopsis sp. NPDC006131]|uniref:hypothetical protein n=1 Tax=Amycolatopsis sp. NPDC006131 TaxID=3156731 RepID=UPI0033BF7DB9